MSSFLDEYILQRANSRLNDRDVKEKVQTYKNKNMGANRQIMYFITEAHHFEWDEKDIRIHYNDLLSLLAKRATILSLQNEIRWQCFDLA